MVQRSLMHNPAEDLTFIRSRLRTLQIIAAALVCGVLLFAMVVAMIAMQQSQSGAPPGTPPGVPATPPASGSALPVDLLRSIAIGLLISATIGALVFNRLAATHTAREFHGTDVTDESTQEAIFGRFFISRIVGLALVESAALLSIVVTLLGGNVANLAIAAVALLVMLLLLFPTAGRWSRFVSDVKGDDGRPVHER